jgi:CDP-glucose 4,6-dehydratase
MRKVFNNVYEGRKVLVTGHTGFKGGWLCAWLHELGAEVIGYSLVPSTDPSIFECAGLGQKITSILGDIRDYNTLEHTFQEHQPEIVFHMAAQPLVRLSYREPRETYESNIMGTVNVLDACRKTQSVKTIVNITSDKCYDNKEWVYGYRENEPMGGYDPYSSSKGCAELVASAYRNSFFNPKDYGNTHTVSLASVRAGNVIGGGDWSEDRLIPDFVKAMVKGDTLVLRNPKATRPWQLVLEPLSGYLWLAALMTEDPIKFSDGWNFGPLENDAITVEEIVQKSLEIWGSGEYKVIPDKNLHEAKLLKLDISKAGWYLDWKPAYTSDIALEETIKWYKNYYIDKHDIYEFTVNQINSYVEAASQVNVGWTKVKEGTLC